jgi:flagellar biosynthesis protein FlhF
MKVMRFAARSARDALAQLRQALGEDAVVLSTRPCAEGVEVLALEPEGLARIEQAAVQADRARAVRAAPQPEAVSEPGLLRSAGLAERIGAGSESPKAQPNRRREPSLDAAPTAGRDTSSGWDTEPSQDPVARDVETLGMSTLSFQDYVRERMLKRRQAELTQQAAAQPAGAVATARPVARLAQVGAAAGQGEASVGEAAPAPQPARQPTSRREPPVLRDEIRTMALGQPGQPAESNSLPAAEPAAPWSAPRAASVAATLSATPRERSELIVELRAVRELIDERFGMLAFLERLQRDPRQAKLSQQLFEAAFSPALVRKLVQSLPADAADPLAWASGVLEHNLLTDEQGLAIEDHRGVFALIGATGVGKTTSTAKLAAAFATKHGAAALGLITLDAYRVAAHEQLRTYGRILGVPVHTAHDRASLEDLLELLSAKTLVLIDTAGMAQRDARTRELLEMLQHRSISKLLVISAAAQGETLEDVMLGYGVQQCLGVIVSKLDEAVKLGPALDALIRYRAKVVAVANGQRVPEDWHRLSSQALVQRALRGGGGNSWRLDAGEVNLLFAATQGGGYPGPQGLVPQV